MKAESAPVRQEEIEEAGTELVRQDEIEVAGAELLRQDETEVAGALVRQNETPEMGSKGYSSRSSWAAPASEAMAARRPFNLAQKDRSLSLCVFIFYTLEIVDSTFTAVRSSQDSA